MVHSGRAVAVRESFHAGYLLSARALFHLHPAKLECRRNDVELLLRKVTEKLPSTASSLIKCPNSEGGLEIGQRVGEIMAHPGGRSPVFMAKRMRYKGCWRGRRLRPTHQTCVMTPSPAPDPLTTGVESPRRADAYWPRAHSRPDNHSSTIGKRVRRATVAW